MPIELDRRSHHDDDLQHLSPARFFADRFPALAAANGHLVVQAITQLGCRPLTIEVDSDVWSIVPDEARLRATPTAVADALKLTFSPDEFSDWCQNQRSLNSFQVARTLQFRGGDVRDLSIWDSLLMTLLYGWPTVGNVEFVDRFGAPLDLRRCFTPADDPADVAHFLREAGFLHLRGWVDPSLMTLISADVDRTLPTYVEGDGKSWWATLGDGRRVCVRLQEFVEHSTATAQMLRSELWDQLRRTIAANDPLIQPPVEGRCIEALVKPVGVVSGPSDVSFHRDCHLGRHAYGCSSAVVGVSLTASDARNGQLRVIPGSHRVAMPVDIAQREPFMNVLALPTELGDLTVHLSCTLHEATPPQIAERRVMYTGFQLESRPTRNVGAGGAISALREQVTNLLRDHS